ncbi:MAG: transcription elongation factor GreA [Candidatus Enteromonas sp.]|nr:transcription elongation factor GreA [Candidatus Enteromonas sp.]MDY6094005.1 transcription elongation factor GreA [Candidatus Enteromonas sp.]
MPKEKTLLTIQELNEINAEYDHLLNVEKPANLADLSLARSQGDLSENSDYDAARAKQAQIEARITEIRSILENCQIVHPTENGIVSIGTTVVVAHRTTGNVFTVRIRGNTGADPLDNPPAVSNESPFGAAVIGKKVGDIATVQAASGDYEVEIQKILIEGQ